MPGTINSISDNLYKLSKIHSLLVVLRWSRRSFCIYNASRKNVISLNKTLEMDEKEFTVCASKAHLSICIYMCCDRLFACIRSRKMSGFPMPRSIIRKVYKFRTVKDAPDPKHSLEAPPPFRKVLVCPGGTTPCMQQSGRD